MNNKLRLFVLVILVVALIISCLAFSGIINRERFKTGVPVYISLTSIFNRQDLLLKTLLTITDQSKKPDKIFLYLSEEPSFFDNGFVNKKITNKELLTFLQSNNNLIKIMWGKDIGPYGKLLPLLKEKWNEDCIIITIDDDHYYDPKLIENLVKDYNKFGCVISYRGFTPKMDTIGNFDYGKRDKLHNLSLYNFPTGVGGILYTPKFFHKTKDLIFNENIFLNTCNKADDVWFYLIRIKNGIKCYINNNVTWFRDIEKSDLNFKDHQSLFFNFNRFRDSNTKALRDTLKKLKVA